MLPLKSNQKVFTSAIPSIQKIYREKGTLGIVELLKELTHADMTIRDKAISVIIENLEEGMSKQEKSNFSELMKSLTNQFCPYAYAVAYNESSKKPSSEYTVHDLRSDLNNEILELDPPEKRSKGLNE